MEARCRWEDAEAVGEIFWGNRTVVRGPRMLLWKTAIKDWTRSQKRDSCTDRGESVMLAGRDEGVNNGVASQGAPVTLSWKGKSHTPFF